jgi:hypothetical protein
MTLSLGITAFGSRPVRTGTVSCLALVNETTLSVLPTSMVVWSLSLRIELIKDRAWSSEIGWRLITVIRPSEMGSSEITVRPAFSERYSRTAWSGVS